MRKSCQRVSGRNDLLSNGIKVVSVLRGHKNTQELRAAYVKRIHTKTGRLRVQSRRTGAGL